MGDRFRPSGGRPMSGREGKGKRQHKHGNGNEG